MHPIEIQTAVQMIDLMLQDASIPTPSRDSARLSVLIEAFDFNSKRPRDGGYKPGHTETTLEEVQQLFGLSANNRIDQRMKWHRFSLALSQLSGREITQRLRSVLDHSQSQG